MSTDARQPATVLVVDDHPLVRKGLRALLESEADLAVAGEAGDGEEAVEKVRRLAPDVVVMDISMPGLNGIDATRQILTEAPATRIVALSIHAEKRLVQDMLRAGAAAYVLKESVPEELNAAIHAVLKGEAFLSPPIVGSVIPGYQQPEESTALEPLLQTKLHRPAPPVDLVPRPRLLERLQSAQTRPLALVSAPAGYGKSVLLSSWLESCACPNAWLSLDAEDSDLRRFISYFVAAVRSAFPAACEEMLRLNKALQLPPLSTLATTLSNELEALPQPFTLVLDDYHCIDAASLVSELLHQLLAHPPRPLHLVIATRRDPPLSLLALRAREQMTEVRMRDLRFTGSEIRTLLEKTLAFNLSDEALANLQQEVEGWVVGLRLVILALHDVEDPEAFLKDLRGGVQQTQEYLIQEVVTRQPRPLRDWLLKTALLDRFCESLCEAVCMTEGSTGTPDFDGARFIAALREGNLFAIPLNRSGEWFRYHHLFQHLLRRELGKRMTSAKISGLHLRASAWFEGQGLIEEAIVHAQAAGNVERAAEIVERSWRAAINQGKWYIVVKWLSRVPDAVVWERPALLMAQAWKHYYYLNVAALPPILDRIDELMGGDAETHDLAREVLVLRGFFAFLRNDGARSLKYLEHALDRIEVNEVQVRAVNETLFGLAGQLEGQGERVARALIAWLNDPLGIHALRESGLLRTLMFMGYISGHPAEAERYLPRHRTVAKKNGLENALAWSDYLEGIFRLQGGEFDAAIQLLEKAGDRKYLFHARAATDALAALTLAYQACQRPERAAATLASLHEFATSFEPSLGFLAESCAARLGIMQGQPEPVLRWLKTSAPSPVEVMIFWFEVPCITRCRALIAEASTASLREAEARLRAYAEMNEAQHNTYQRIGIWALQAMGQLRQEKLDEACSALEQALTLAQPSRIIFPFLELGRPLAKLLRRMPEKAVNAAFIEQILAAFGEADEKVEAVARPDRASPPLSEPLTHRELDILELLAQRLQNKEIAARLFVSTETVKSHLKNLYQKLHVSNRREAARKAAEIVSLRTGKYHTAGRTDRE